MKTTPQQRYDELLAQYEDVCRDYTNHQDNPAALFALDEWEMRHGQEFHLLREQLEDGEPGPVVPGPVSSWHDGTIPPEARVGILIFVALHVIAGAVALAYFFTKN